MPVKSRHALDVDGRKVDITNPDKVFYPETGFTKAQVIQYYIGISGALLPHLKDRPLSLKRYPHGVGGAYFYQKEAPGHHPDWMRTTPVWSDERGQDINYCVADDLPSLVWLANAGDLEMHAFLHRAKDLERPTQVAFDLDPGPGTDAVTCGRVALVLKHRLDDLGLESFVKVSGSKGVQMHVPLNTPVTYERTKEFSKGLAFSMAKEFPKEVTALMRKELRVDKVFIDWSQNDPHKTTVCVYSMRGVDTPSVASPLSWEELEQAVLAKDLKRLRFTPEQVVGRFEEDGDLFAEVETMKQKLPDLDRSERAPAPVKPKAKPKQEREASKAKPTSRMVGENPASARKRKLETA